MKTQRMRTMMLAGSVAVGLAAPAAAQHEPNVTFEIGHGRYHGDLAIEGDTGWASANNVVMGVPITGRLKSYLGGSFYDFAGASLIDIAGGVSVRLVDHYWFRPELRAGFRHEFFDPMELMERIRLGTVRDPRTFGTVGVGVQYGRATVGFRASVDKGWSGGYSMTFTSFGLYYGF